MALFTAMFLGLVAAPPAANAWVISTGYNATCLYGNISVNWVGKDDRSCRGIVNVYYQGYFAYQLNAGGMYSPARTKCELRVARDIIEVFAGGSWKRVAKGLTKKEMSGRYPGCNYQTL